MTYENVINLLLFDYLIENHDRHYGNIGVDSNTGDIAPYYDNAASLSLVTQDKLTMLYDEAANRRISHSEIPHYLASFQDGAFLKYGSEFYKRCRDLNIYDILLKLKKCMSTMKYEDYEEKMPKLIDNRVQTIRDVLTKMTGG